MFQILLIHDWGWGQYFAIPYDKGAPCNRQLRPLCHIVKTCLKHVWMLPVHGQYLKEWQVYNSLHRMNCTNKQFYWYEHTKWQYQWLSVPCKLNVRKGCLMTVLIKKKIEPIVATFITKPQRFAQHCVFVCLTAHVTNF